MFSLKTICGWAVVVGMANVFASGGDISDFCRFDHIRTTTADELLYTIGDVIANRPIDSIRCPGKNTLLGVAIMAGATIEVIEELVDMGASVREPNKDGIRPIDLVSQERGPRLFEVLSAADDDDWEGANTMGIIGLEEAPTKIMRNFDNVTLLDEEVTGKADRLPRAPSIIAERQESDENASRPKEEESDRKKREFKKWGWYWHFFPIQHHVAINREAIYEGPEGHFQEDGTRTDVSYFSGGIMLGPLRFGVASLNQNFLPFWAPVTKHDEALRYVTKEARVLYENIEDSVHFMGNGDLVFDVFFDLVNDSRVTPYVGSGWGEIYVSVYDTQKGTDLYDHSTNKEILGGNTFYQHLSYGITVGIGKHPTPENKIRTEFELGLRHYRGGSIGSEDRNYSYSGGTAVTWGFRVTSRHPRWRWW